VQYVDDMFIIMPVEAHQLFFLKCLLQTYASATGLKVNFSKSLIVPINVLEEKVEILAGTLGCQVGTMSFTYLRLPMGTTKPVMQDFVPLLSRVEKRLMGITPFTSYVRHLTWNNDVLSALPTYFMCVIQLSMETIDQINKYRRHCLWRGLDLNKKGNCLAVWSKVQRPKSQGGLGIIDLSA
jgi:hypothetical protein